MANSKFDYDPPISLVRELMREYAAQLPIDLNFQNFEAELLDLPGRYQPPQGCLIVASIDDQPAGCGAFRRLSPDCCEMKRLYLRPAFRGYGLGRQIATALLIQAKAAGYQTMRLDTLAFMQEAASLYRSLGFREIEAYYANPTPGCLYFEATLA